MVADPNALKSYQDEVKIIQDKYRNDMKLYEAQAEVYQAQMVEFQTERLAYETARNSAVQSAEGLIESVKEKYGWAFINKNDPKIFYPWLIETWEAQLIIAGVYFLIILFAIKRKDV